MEWLKRQLGLVLHLLKTHEKSGLDASGKRRSDHPQVGGTLGAISLKGYINFAEGW